VKVPNMKMWRVVLHLLMGVALAVSGGIGCRSSRKPAIAGPGTTQPVDGSWNPTGSGGSTDGINTVGGEGGIGSDLPGAGSLTGDEASPLADVYFDYDSAAVTAEAQGVLQRHAEWIQRHPQVRLSVEGHCDERGTIEYNLSLGEQRARAVYDYLTSLGVPGARLSTVSFGKERPLDSGRGESAWAKNRRVHFAVSG
jgi:peptidoglycan-associated lipoprotein